MCVCAIMSVSSPVRQLSRATRFVSLLFICKASLCTEISSTDHCLDGLCSLCAVISSHWCSVLLHQCIRKTRIARRVSARASSALLQWPSSSASCSSQPIRCCGMAWSSPAHCEPCLIWPLLRNMHQKLHFLLVGRAWGAHRTEDVNPEKEFCVLYLFRRLWLWLISGSEGCPPSSAWHEHARAPHWIPFNAITSRVLPRCVFFSFLSLKDEDFVRYLTPSHVRWERWGVIGSLSCGAAAGCLASKACACSSQMHCMFCSQHCSVEAYLWNLLKILFNVEGTVGIFGIAYYHNITFTVCSLLCTCSMQRKSQISTICRM